MVMKHIKLYEEFKEIGTGTEISIEGTNLTIKQNDGMTNSFVRLNKEETEKMMSFIHQSGKFA